MIFSDSRHLQRGKYALDCFDSENSKKKKSDSVSVLHTINLITYLGKSWKLEKRFFDGAIVIHMDSVLKHVVDEIGIWLHKIIQMLKILKLLALLLVKDVEVDVTRIQFHVFKLLD